MSAQPAEEAVEAYDAVLRLGGEDIQELRQSIWRLEGLWRRHRAATMTRDIHDWIDDARRTKQLP